MVYEHCQKLQHVPLYCMAYYNGFCVKKKETDIVFKTIKPFNLQKNNWLNADNILNGNLMFLE